jgi:uncharacterized lipoprotein YmbA
VYRSLITLPLVAALALTGCSATTNPAGSTVDLGDKQACTDWAGYEQGMLQVVSVIQHLAADPKGLTQDVVTQFNTARNNLLVAYDTAGKEATSKSIKDALSTAASADSAIYYNLPGATNKLIQKSITSVTAVVKACSAAGVDLSSILKQSSN